MLTIVLVDSLNLNNALYFMFCRHISLLYGEGDLCDETGKGRFTEVKLK